MRIDESANPFLNSVRSSTYLNFRRPQQTQGEINGSAPSTNGGFTVKPTSTDGSVSVQISREARQAYEAYSLGATKKDTREKDEVREDFLRFMEKSRKAAKDKKEQIKEQKAKLKQLQGELQKVASDEQMPQEVKAPKMEAINTQIQQVMQTIANMSRELAGEQEPEAEV